VREIRCLRPPADDQEGLPIAAACWDRVDYGDPCKWGQAPANGTQTPHSTPAPSHSSDNWPGMPNIPDLPDFSDPTKDWWPFEGPHATPAPPPPNGGWEPIAGPVLVACASHVPIRV